MRAFLPVPDLELDPLIRLQRSEPVAVDGRVVHEHIIGTAVLGDEPDPFLSVEPLHCSLRHRLTPRYASVPAAERPSRPETVAAQPIARRTSWEHYRTTGQSNAVERLACGTPITVPTRPERCGVNHRCSSSEPSSLGVRAKQQSIS